MDTGVPGWLEEQLPGALRLATLLTGSGAEATGLVATSVGRLPRRKLQASGDREPSWDLFRAALVGTYLGRQVTGVQPEPGPLDGLSPLERACVVLRLDQQATLAEIAAIVDRSPAATSGMLDAALARLGPGAPHEISRLARRTPDPAGVVAALRHSGQDRRHRSRLALVVVGAVAAVGLFALLVPLAVLPLLPTPGRDGDWVLVHRVDPPEAWRRTDHTIAPTYEETTLRPSDPGAQTICVVHVDLAGVAPPTEQEAVRRTAARINGKRGYFEAGDPPRIAPYLAWEYSPGAWAQVRCTPVGPLDKAMLAGIADGVRFVRTPLLLPFALDALPADYRVLYATESLTTPSAELILAKIDLRPGDANLSLTFVPGASANGEGGAVRVLHLDRGRALYDTTPGHPRLCLDERERKYVCISGYWPLGDWPALAPEPVNVAPTIIGVAESLRLATDLADRATWLPATEALPR